MVLRNKSAYHPYFILAFHLHCLPTDRLQLIPRSTRHEWLHKDHTALVGYDWYLQHESLFHTLQQVATNNRLLRVNLALLRIIALQRFIKQHARQLKVSLLNVNAVVLTTLQKIIPVLGQHTALKYLRQSCRWLYQLRHAQRCRSSLLFLCRIKHPAQLLLKEIHLIKSYCSDPRFLCWPLSSVYHQILKDGAAAFNLSTFYKYVNLLQLRRIRPPHRRKNHHTGIRAVAPFQILHADTTIFRTADHSKNYIYLLQDNFSRSILSYRIATICSPKFTFENLYSVHRQYLQPAGLTSCQLLTDDGSENAGAVKEWTSASSHPAIQQLIAQRDVECSNSMIEAANKQLKYHFLYHQHIPDHAALIHYVKQAVEQFNHRPHHVLRGLSPFEVLNGESFDAHAHQRQMQSARKRRLIENTKEKCCRYSF